MKKQTIYLIILILMYGFSIQAQPGNSLFADRRAMNIGDIITIIVIEYSSASSEAKTTTQKENDHGLIATGGAQSSAYSPMFGVRGNLKNNFRGNAAVQRKGRLQTKITASIIEIDGNGNLLLQGNRIMDVNGEKEETSITGTVRPEDVSWNNTVYSYQLADARIVYKGQGVVNSGQKPGFIAKLFNWMF